ncbi:MAG: hypothetical protein ABW174_11215 [Flavitalea sp.]
MKKKYAIILFALLFCLFVYVFYRTGKTVVTSLSIDLLGAQNYDQMRSFLQELMPLPDLVVYSIPEGLWVFCITLTSVGLYVIRPAYDLVYLPLIFASGLELFQFVGLTKGTFDFVDLGISLLAWIAARHLVKQREVVKEFFSPFDKRSFICLVSYLIVYLAHVLN